MRRRNRVSESSTIRQALLPLAVFLILSLAMAGPAFAEPDAQYGGIYRIHNTPIRSLDPHMETASQTTMVTVNTKFPHGEVRMESIREIYRPSAFPSVA